MKELLKIFKNLSYKALSPIRFIMLHKLGKRKGFSLIELLVVIGIIGVLAAVAVPAYQSYRENAAKSALKISLKNVGKAYQVCRVKPDDNDLDDCDTLSEINVACEKCKDTSEDNGDPRWCVHAEDGAQKACLFVAGSTAPPVVIAKGENPKCSTLYSEFECPSGGTWTTPSGATLCSGFTGCTTKSHTYTGSSCGTQRKEYVVCEKSGDPEGKATSSADGTCDTSLGTCE